MIKRLVIKRFKSIKQITLNCKRINIFIGKPDTGKSNILEVIGFLRHFYYGDLSRFVRLSSMLDLFYYRNTSKPIEITVDDKTVKVYRAGDVFIEKLYDKETETVLHRHSYDIRLSYSISTGFLERV